MATGGQALRTSLGERFRAIPHPGPQSQPPDAQAPAPPPGPHSPVEIHRSHCGPPTSRARWPETKVKVRSRNQRLHCRGGPEGPGVSGGRPSGLHCPEHSHPSRGSPTTRLGAQGHLSPSPLPSLPHGLPLPNSGRHGGGEVPLAPVGTRPLTGVESEAQVQTYQLGAELGSVNVLCPSSHGWT